MKKKDILKEIIIKKKERIILAKQNLPEEELKERIKELKPTNPFIKAILKPHFISLIAEIKKQSPSKGIIRNNFNPLEIARIYQDAGVQAISVLTEEDYFGGSILTLAEIKKEIKLPMLRKDFILEPYQIYESRFYGADAVLLIATVLSKERLKELMDLAKEIGLETLVEVHDEKELKKVLSLKASLIGINNRDLHTLEVDLKTTERLYPLIPKDKVVVVESGIRTHQDVLFLKLLGVNAVLIGEAIMEAEDIRRRIEELMGW
ncbi:MAG: indole-3-glycerol phosphate synthase TrpC [Candidatus Omnitrophica bacterium]|nr:indole-3-glycerol phosphate synthase TrpC [Candidatus Omnitrophota bacterium]